MSMTADANTLDAWRSRALNDEAELAALREWSET
jgi:hypothetical protein